MTAAELSRHVPESVCRLSIQEVFMPAVAKSLVKKKPTIVLQKTRNPIPEGARIESVRALQPVQCAAIELYLQLKNAHWNVRGSNFEGLHRLFEETAGELEQIADTLAERVAVLGGEPLATVQKLAAVPNLADAPAGMKAQDEFVRLICDRLAFYIQMLANAMDSFERNSDYVSQDICTKATGVIEKKLWRTESHLPVRS
jgi:starvation-inducible DNA-binding protein